MEPINELAAALAAAQGEILPAPKDADNPYFKTKYASLPAIREAMREAFAKHGLSVVQIPEVIDGRLQLHTLLLHASGQWLDCGTLTAEVDLTNPQKIGAFTTYFRRYSLAAISQAVGDEDLDSSETLQEPKSQPKSPPRSAAKQEKPTEKEQVYINEALAEIAKCPSLEALNALIDMFKAKSPAIHNALRGLVVERRNQLKEQANA
jgi:hypothetical protein